MVASHEPGKGREGSSPPRVTSCSTPLLAAAQFDAIRLRSREFSGAYGERLTQMPVLADIRFDSGDPPEIFEVHEIRKS